MHLQQFAPWQCTPDPASYRVWKVTNPNPVPLAFTWDIHGEAGQSGSGNVPAAQGATPGEATFTTQTVLGANTARIFVGGVLQDTQPSTTAVCP